MILDDVLGELIVALDTTDKPYIVNWHTAQRWPSKALDTLIQNGILTKTKQAESIECRACEAHCFVDVHIVTREDKPTRAFVVCEEPEMQGQMGLIQIPLEQLRQWRITALQLANALAGLLGFENKVEQKQGQDYIRIGTVKGKHGRKWVLMTISPLELDINGHVIPWDEAIYFEGNELRLDRDKIQYCADNTPKQHNKPYSPSTTKQQARKLNTDVRNEEIRQAYLDIRKQYPWSSLHTDQWVAKEISKRDIAQGCSIPRIIRIMKG